MTQELRKLAKRLRKGQTHDFKTGYLLDQSDVMDESADAIDALLDRLEKAEKDAERLLPLLKQAHSVVEGSYSEEYDQGFEEIVSAALFTEIQAMEASK